MKKRLQDYAKRRAIPQSFALPCDKVKKKYNSNNYYY